MQVPPGLWVIYSTEKICCNSNYPYSEKCVRGTDAPTKQPVASPEFDDMFQVVPIKFSVSGLPEVVDHRELKDEMQTILRGILIDLSTRMSSLKLKNIEENLLGSKQTGEEGRKSKDTVDVYYEVTVVREKGKDFGPIIIQWVSIKTILHTHTTITP